MLKKGNFLLVTKYLLAGVTVFCVTYIASIGEWHNTVRWEEERVRGKGLSTMRTIVAYSERKQAEMERPNPVTCDKLPAFPHVPKINRTWSASGRWDGVSSWQRVAGTEALLFNAYYDDRLKQHYIRVLVSAPGGAKVNQKPLYCQTRLQNKDELSFSDAFVEVVAARSLEIWYKTWNFPQAKTTRTSFLLSCPLIAPLSGPSVVSIVTEPCEDPTNGFIVKPQTLTLKRNFTVCVKDMNFENDISEDIIEWIETNRILGVEKIDMYIEEIHKETEEVLQHYRDSGFLRLFHVPLNHNRNDSNIWQRRKDHIITYNDCLYRNLGESNFIIPLDIDEIILPKIANNLAELVDRLSRIGWNENNYTAALTRNVFFFEFNQKNFKYKCKKTKSHNSDIYMKRDDVRFVHGDTNINTYNFSSDKDIVDKYNEDAIEMKYKRRCFKELKEPKIFKHTSRSRLVSPDGYYGKSLMATKSALTAFNHYPLAGTRRNARMAWFVPFEEAQLSHYKKVCVTKLVPECPRYMVHTVEDCTALRLRRNLTRALAGAPCFRPIN